MIDPSFPTGPVAAAKRDLFLVSLLFLFMELAFIRWFPAQVLFLTFFTNTVLLASFLGLSLGCLAARSRRNYLSSTPVLLVISIIAAAAVPVTAWISYRAQGPLLPGFLTLLGLLVIVRHKSNIQRLINGTESRFQKKNKIQDEAPS